jgi:hypothetical protein
MSTKPRVATYLVPMTSSTASAAEGSTIMASTARIVRIVIVATGILALSVTAAQARPIGVGFTGQSAAANVSNAYHSFYGPQALYKHDAATKVSSVMSPAVDPPNAQQVPIVVTQAVPQPINVADSGFNWTAGMLGAGIATLVLLLAAILATRIRPRRVAHL